MHWVGLQSISINISDFWPYRHHISTSYINHGILFAPPLEFKGNIGQSSCATPSEEAHVEKIKLLFLVDGGPQPGTGYAWIDVTVGHRCIIAYLRCCRMLWVKKGMSHVGHGWTKMWIVEKLKANENWTFRKTLRDSHCLLHGMILRTYSRLPSAAISCDRIGLSSRFSEIDAEDRGVITYKRLARCSADLAFLFKVIFGANFFGRYGRPMIWISICLYGITV